MGDVWLANFLDVQLNVIFFRVIAIQEEATVMKWARGEISNFTYLMILNHAAGNKSHL
jgi:hypothetical protein